MQESYDYIVVGAGSAGSVLADRLSACGRHRVLVLEAGGSDRRFWIRMPLGYAKTFHDPAVNWRFHAEPDPGLDGRAAYWPRGRVLGGSSAINAMAYMRGLAADFDAWQAAGAAGWAWADVHPVFEAMERREGTNGAGPVYVGDCRARAHPFTRHFLAAARELGWPAPDDPGTGTAEGLAPIPATIRAGRRWSSADAHLRPALKRPNLRLITHALVERIELSGRRVTGVRFRVGGQRVTARARREVVLAAGALGSPQILQLSGIGPPELLKRHGLPVHHVLPEVGRGLQDHLGISHMFRATEPTLNTILGRAPGRLRAGLRYLLTRGGPLSLPVNQIGGFVRSGPDAPVPDLQIYANPVSYRTDAAGRTRVDPDPGFLLSAQPCRPTSRGEVILASPDPTAAPLIRPNSLATEHDRAMAVRAGRILLALAATETLAAVSRDRRAPAPAMRDDAALLADFRARASTVFHPSSTCRMGRSAADSVLDPRLRVHGIAGLRVADAAAFPSVTSGNINAPVMMLARRGADYILEDARQPNGNGGLR